MRHDRGLSAERAGTRAVAASRAGLTLLEVIAALAISALVLGAAGALIQSLADAEQRARQAMARAIDDLATERVVRSAVLAADLGGTAPLAWLSGPGEALVLKARCPTARGWSEPCALTFVPGDTLRVGLGTHQASMADWHVESLLLLQDASLGGLWVDRWLDSLRLPQAIGVVRRQAIGLDTVILRIGDRG